MTGLSARIHSFVAEVQKRYKLGTVVYVPREFLLFGPQTIQASDMTITIHGDSELNDLDCFLISIHRRKMLDEELNEVELRSFRSVNGSIRQLVTNASVFCTFYASWLQQKALNSTVQDLITQFNALRLLKKLGTTVYHKRTPSGNYKISLEVHADTSRRIDHRQLCFTSGLLFGDLASGSTIHIISWSSRKSRRPVESIGFAETLSTGEAIDKAKALVKAFNELLELEIELWIALYSKDLFTALSTCSLASDSSIRGDVSSIRFEFATKVVSSMIWVPGKINLADPGTKTDSPLTDLLQLMLVSGSIPVKFTEAVVQSSDQFTGKSLHQKRGKM